MLGVLCAYCGLECTLIELYTGSVRSVVAYSSVGQLSRCRHFDNRHEAGKCSNFQMASSELARLMVRTVLSTLFNDVVCKHIHAQKCFIE